MDKQWKLLASCNVMDHQLLCQHILAEAKEGKDFFFLYQLV